jgi:hypothetical protein
VDRSRQLDAIRCHRSQSTDHPGAVATTRSPRTERAPADPDLTPIGPLPQHPPRGGQPELRRAAVMRGEMGVRPC